MHLELDLPNSSSQSYATLGLKISAHVGEVVISEAGRVWRGRETRPPPDPTTGPTRTTIVCMQIAIQLTPKPPSSMTVSFSSSINRMPQVGKFLQRQNRGLETAGFRSYPLARLDP